MYKMYLNQYDVVNNEVDYFTEVVANQTKKLMSFFVDNTRSFPHDFEPSIKIFYKDKYVPFFYYYSLQFIKIRCQI